MAGSTGGDLSVLPEGCVANVLSFTGPLDVGRLSIVSSTFKSAAESDAVWEQFLPPEYHSIISESSDSSLLACSSSKKELYLHLCDNPVLIEDGKKSFSLDKVSGKKCYMLSARDLIIVWGDNPTYWRWTSEHNSRFPEVAELIGVCWLEIRGKINTCLLSQDTLYGAYLVYKTTPAAYVFEDQPVDVTLGLAGTEGCKRSVYILDTKREQEQDYQQQRQQRQIAISEVGVFGFSAMGWRAPEPTREKNKGEYPKEREDGWVEIELGEFFNNKGEEGELEMSISEVNGGDWKGGLIILGIEIRPKRG
ncbi:F-box protein At2g02240 [Manihot esculenta]|uniref:F-box domain-containing protein n=1 Tax=Manihot esculenta TaxID=3983 RepID=A0A2C9VGF8_MANES|nr:F-box protein At2g02240 [Manihot esculenta]